jgi:hypothetical protein
LKFSLCNMNNPQKFIGESGNIHEFKMVYNFHDKNEIELLRLLESKPKGIFVFARITRQLPDQNDWAQPTISPIYKLIHQQGYSLEFIKSKMIYGNGSIADFIYFKECVDENVLESISKDLRFNDCSKVKI